MAELAGIGQYKTVDPKFVRSAKAEADAIKAGMTKEYIESRGGVNASGYYGDSWSAEKNLSDAEYAAIVAKGGNVGAAINAATDKKQGFTPSSFTGFSASTSKPEPTYIGSGAINDPLKLNGTLYTGEYNGLTYVNGVSTISLAAKAERQSAYDSLLAEFNKYGLGSLVKDIRGLIEKDVPPSQFVIELRNTEAYQNRFKANAERIKKGFSALNESDYIRNEDAYRNTLRKYGLTQFDNDEYVSKFISNDIRPEELGERVLLAVNRIKMADPLISRTLREYFPNITQQDLVGYILDPSTQLPSIQQKITTAEIGSAARRQGIEPGVSVASQLAAQGITEADAQKGYAIIADILPTAEKLSGLYGKSMETYGLTEGEQEQFNQLASAQRKRKNLIGREIAEFSGQSGVARGSLGTATGGQY